MKDADVAIVGSGPAGTSVAWPLVQAGCSVIMLDTGNSAGGESVVKPGSLLTRRESDPELWRQMLGSDLFGLRHGPEVPPKLRAPAFRHVQEGFQGAYGLVTENMAAAGSLARGGLSAMWGAGAYTFNEEDFKGWPIDRADLKASYRHVIERIGVSGAVDDIGPDDASLGLLPPLELHDTAQHLLTCYQRKRPSMLARGFRLGRARNAVITRAQGDRAACELDGTCLWGCARGAIYSADMELPKLATAGSFRYIGRAFATGIEKTAAGYRIEYTDPSNQTHTSNLHVSRVILAAGAIASTILVLRYLKRSEAFLRCHPAFVMAFVVPARIGCGASRRLFGLGQLSYELELRTQSEHQGCFGVLFSAEGFLLSDLVRRVPLSTPAAIRVISALAPAMLIANGYLPGSYVECRLSLEPDRATLVGSVPARYEPLAKLAQAKLAACLRGCGAWAALGGSLLVQPGLDGHFGASLPMSHQPRHNSVTVDGELHGAPGIHVVDGAILPTLPPRHPTLTIMANADRIGHRIAERLRKNQ